MDRINGADWVDIGGGKRGFRSQNKAAGIAGTEVTDDWLNDLQENLARVVEDQGVALASGNWALFQEAVRRTIRLYANIPVKGWQSAPPGAPAEGDAYIVKAAGSGAWLNQNHKIAVYFGGAWAFRPATTGQMATYSEAGKFRDLWFDGAVWAKATGGIEFSQTIATAQVRGSSNTFIAPGAGVFVVPVNVYSVYAEVWGGGGSGGSALANSNGGSGGGGGGYAARWLIVTPGQNIAYTIGAGAAAPAEINYSGAAGGSSSIDDGAGVVISATGGGGGTAANPTAPGATSTNSGGTGAGGAVSLQGSRGSSGSGPSNTSGANGGIGGFAPLGGSGGPGRTGIGLQGTAPGGGGAGAGGLTATGTFGGAGADGRVRFSWSTVA